LPLISEHENKVILKKTENLGGFMAYKIIDIQGIGEAYAPKLIAIGIKTPDELLEA